MYKELTKSVEMFLQNLTPKFLEKEIWKLLRTSPDRDGGIDAYRLVRHFLRSPGMDDIQTTWAYQRIRPVFEEMFEDIPSLYFFTGD
jgi:hypothetical protein